MSAATHAKLIAEPPLLVLPSLAVAIGLNEAVALQQIYFKTRESDLAWWPRDTAELRAMFPFWSWPTIRRTLASLERAGLVRVRQDAGGDRRDRTKRYRVQIDALHRLNLSTKRGDASTQVGAVSFINSERGKARGREARPHNFDSQFEEPSA